MKKPLLILTLLFLVTSTAGFSLWQETKLAKNPLDETIRVFSVEKGQGLFTIGQNLSQQNLIRRPLSFNLAVFLLNGSKKLQAGDYELSPSWSATEIARKMMRGETAKQELVIPEGWGIEEISQGLKSLGLFTQSDFFRAVGLPASRQVDSEACSSNPDLVGKLDLTAFDFLRDKPRNLNLEGYLFPDTYELAFDETPESAARKMLANFGEKLNPELRAEIKKQGKSIFEVVTMASLLEKEVKTPAEKKLVSGILWKRLRVGMRLQVDSTIAYALGENPERVSLDQTQICSHYNTYRYGGLSLGPIANPGLESLVAAVYPTESAYWYYLSTPSGQILFSQTLEEHNVKKVKYLNN